MPLILGTNSIKDTGYNVAHSTMAWMVFLKDVDDVGDLVWPEKPE